MEVDRSSWRGLRGPSQCSQRSKTDLFLLFQPLPSLVFSPLSLSPSPFLFFALPPPSKPWKTAEMAKKTHPTSFESTILPVARREWIQWLPVRGMKEQSPVFSTEVFGADEENTEKKTSSWVRPQTHRHPSSPNPRNYCNPPAGVALMLPSLSPPSESHRWHYLHGKGATVQCGRIEMREWRIPIRGGSTVQGIQVGPRVRDLLCDQEILEAIKGRDFYICYLMPPSVSNT